MMRATVVADPKPPQAKVRFQVGGERCTCYIPGDAWESPECEQLYADWSRTPGSLWETLLAVKIDDDALPWYGAKAERPTYRDINKPWKDLVARRAPDGLYVGFRLAPKQTRNPKCFRGIRYFAAWKPGSAPPCSDLHEVRLLLRPPSPPAPAASDVPLPFGLASL